MRSGERTLVETCLVEGGHGVGEVFDLFGLAVAGIVATLHVAVKMWGAT